MARKKPASGKQKKSALQEHRAVKRGDVVDTPSGNAKHKSQLVIGRSTALGTVDWKARAKAKELQSSFVGLTKEYIETANRRAFNAVLPRPLSREVSRFRNPVQLEQDPELRRRIQDLDERLWCPIRPKWRHSMTKNELDRNEETQFAKWLEGMDAIHEEYMALPRHNDQGQVDMRSPSFFERNLSVWRQLWRVMEQSQIILVMVDVRCPPVHLPASLRTYLKNLVTPATRRQKQQQDPSKEGEDDKFLKPPKGANPGRKRVILVLTKTDLVDEAATEGWTQWCKDWWKYGYNREEEVGADETDDVQVVCVRSYADQPVEDQRGRRRHIPEIPHSALDELLHALETAHAALLQPPPSLLEQPEKLANWRKDCISKVKHVVNWQEFKHLPQNQEDAEVIPAVISKHKEEEEHPEAEDETREDREAESLTIGLIGQPNCGKSSLLNALMGRSRVRASKTPGKTKHFQSIYWSKDVRIVDCPGLVLPSLTGVEMQVQAGILPISQVSSVASCIHHIACLMPLEKALQLSPPARWQEERDRQREMQSRITTRRQDDQMYQEGSRTVSYEKHGAPASALEERWTAGDILQGWAEYRGYVTAKAGRPDTNRAGNEILRTVVEGRIPWRFLPPPCGAGEVADNHQEDKNGIWLPNAPGLQAADQIHYHTMEEDSDQEGTGSVGNTDADDSGSQAGGADTDSDSDNLVSKPQRIGVQSRFAALNVGEEDDQSEDDSEE